MKKVKQLRYDAKVIAENLYKEWLKSKKNEQIHSIGMGSPIMPTSYTKGKRGEKYVFNKLKDLKKQNNKFDVARTPGSKTPADVIAIEQNQSSVYFFLIQVKAGTNQYVNNKHKEADTLDILASILEKKVLKIKVSKEKRNIIIHKCFILIPFKDKINKEKITIKWIDSEIFKGNLSRLGRSKNMIKNVFCSVNKNI